MDVKRLKGLKDAANRLYKRARYLDGELVEGDASSVMSLLIETIKLLQSVIHQLDDAPTPDETAPTDYPVT